jgi:diaminopimelate epimerase
MAASLILEFTKMNGAGNDFIVIDNRFYVFSDEELSALARRYCPRRIGVGADGLLALNAPQQEGAHYRMRYFNADGSRGTMCGNGARCLARFARMAGLKEEPLWFETDAGLYRAEVPTDPQAPIRLYVPPPQHYRFTLALETPLSDPIEVAAFIWTGTEHLVCFVPSVEAVDVAYWGARLRHDPALQPRGANVNFVEVLGEGAVRVRTFEKGVETETLACGTGALAAALVAWQQQRVQQLPIAVHMPGGILTVGFDPVTGSELFLEGPVAVVYRGTVEVPMPLVS